MSDVIITISRRFRGPPESANGGYACGLLARHVRGGSRVRLHSPPPLEEPLTIRAANGSALSLVRDGEIIAESAAAEPDAEAPEPVSFGAAERASPAYRWFTGHPFPGCFVCGPERDAGDGLRIFPGRVAGRPLVAAPWVPDASVCDLGRRVQEEVMWAALDCPSWFGVLEFEPGATRALLGQLTARVLRRPAVEEPCVVIGWSGGSEGRKLYGAAAVYTSEGELLGKSEAVWIAPRA